MKQSAVRSSRMSVCLARSALSRSANAGPVSRSSSPRPPARQFSQRRIAYSHRAVGRVLLSPRREQDALVGGSRPVLRSRVRYGYVLPAVRRAALLRLIGSAGEARRMHVQSEKRPGGGRSARPRGGAAVHAGGVVPRRWPHHCTGTIRPATSSVSRSSSSASCVIATTRATRCASSISPSIWSAGWLRLLRRLCPFPIWDRWS
jgi:hypothetical protein